MTIDSWDRVINANHSQRLNACYPKNQDQFFQIHKGFFRKWSRRRVSSAICLEQPP